MDVADALEPHALDDQLVTAALRIRADRTERDDLRTVLEFGEGEKVAFPSKTLQQRAVFGEIEVEMTSRRDFVVAHFAANRDRTQELIALHPVAQIFGEPSDAANVLARHARCRLSVHRGPGCGGGLNEGS